MFIFGTFSLIPLAIIVFGAYHVWLTINSGLSKMLHHWEESRIKTWSAAAIAITILIMVAPLLIPTGLYIREFVFGMYVIYGGTTVVHVIMWWNKRHQNTDASSNKTDKNGK
jgi:undecaprenyl pyrophosphate phosphatase UppP